MALPIPNIVFDAQDRGGAYMGKLNALAQAVNAAVGGVNANDGPASTAFGWGNHATAGYLKSNDLTGYAYSKSQANGRYATAAQGAKADSAVQDSDMSSYTYSKSQADGRYATAAQGAKADSAVQPGALANVATSGNYNHLSNNPSLGTAAGANKVSGTGDTTGGRLIDVDWYNASISGSVDLSGYAKTNDLANVATSGNYNHLSSRPSLGSAASRDAVSGASDATGNRLADVDWVNANSNSSTYAVHDFGISRGNGSILLADWVQLEANPSSPPPHERATITLDCAAHNYWTGCTNINQMVSGNMSHKRIHEVIFDIKNLPSVATKGFVGFIEWRGLSQVGAGILFRDSYPAFKVPAGWSVEWSAGSLPTLGRNNNQSDVLQIKAWAGIKKVVISVAGVYR